MSYDDQQDPNQQDATQDPQSQDQWSQQDPNQQGATQQDPQTQNQGFQQDPNQQNPGQQGQGGMLGGLEQMAQQQVDQGIDQLAQKVPGGQEFSQQAIDASSGILSNIEGDAEKRLGGLGDEFGGASGGNEESQGNP